LALLRIARLGHFPECGYDEALQKRIWVTDGYSPRLRTIRYS
jgi:hypothetical protein